LRENFENVADARQISDDPQELADVLATPASSVITAPPAAGS
jgi:hypothetical protein